ncbi:MAG TPA: hypothetical protein VJU79_09050, partial [Candidatus Dormibacteraeota bacterium]|nr:hypothetical protein [Candidatus Dormibacteraeota bacterium]
TAQLLEQALVVHSHASDQNCPVCGSKDVLSFEWRRQAGERIAQLKTEAAEYDKARSRVSHAIRTARQLVTAIPSALRDAQGMQLDTEPVIEQWRVWAQLPDGEDPVRLASHLETHGAALGRSIAALRKQANAELERRESSWRPTAQAISEWLALARRAQAGAPKAKQLKDAERWLRDAYDELRDERFRPIADAVQLNWTELRQDSNVSLGELRLEGAAARRRLALDVRVDGEPGSALGVMSQGELNCLALSLFLPRASMPESPFHFLVIDDPVQAMDPSKVEGLAMVLARTAKTRQVVVLTHDDRLADVMRFLNIEATVIEVVRRENSSVATQLIRDPVQRYIDDARAIALTEDLPAEAARVIPGFCRLALEAAAALAVTRRMLREGKPYDDVHTALAQPTTLNMWLALALLKDASRAGDVASYLEREHPKAVDAVRDVNKGAHGGSVLRDPRGLINVVEKLTTVLLDKN